MWVLVGSRFVRERLLAACGRARGSGRGRAGLSGVAEARSCARGEASKKKASLQNTARAQSDLPARAKQPARCATHHTRGCEQRPWRGENALREQRSGVRGIAAGAKRERAAL